MTRYLLDTNVALIAMSDPDRLPPAVRKTILRAENLLSVISYWEVLLKSAKGTLDVGDPRSWWAAALDQLVATPLPLRPEHVAAAWDLPSIHKDPFDRILIAQAIAEDVGLVTTDEAVQKYRSCGLRVV